MMNKLISLLLLFATISIKLANSQVYIADYAVFEDIKGKNRVVRKYSQIPDNGTLITIPPYYKYNSNDKGEINISLNNHTEKYNLKIIKVNEIKIKNKTTILFLTDKGVVLFTEKLIRNNNTIELVTVLSIELQTKYISIYLIDQYPIETESL